MSDPDQESYSIDEMLNRLRSRNDGPGEGEPQLVTRADGSQALKVRRRKRRSRQPHKEAEKRRRKRNLIIASLIIGTVVAAALGVVGWVFYLNSSAYEAGVRDDVESWTGAEVEFTRFRATPVSVGADQVLAAWPEGSPVARLRLNHIRGDLKLSSHLGSDWTGQQLRAASGELVLRAAPADGAATPALPDGAIPFEIPLEAASLNVRFGAGEHPALQVTGTRASFRVPNPEVHAGSLIFQGGRFRLGSWGVFDLEFASLHLGGEDLRIGNLRFRPVSAPEAEIHLLGQDMPGVLVHGGESELRAEFTNVPSASVLGSGLGRLVDGRFQTIEDEKSASVCFFDVTDLSSVRLEAPLEATLGTRVVLNKLPCFEVIADELDAPRLAQPGFDALARATVLRDGEGCRLERLRLASRDEVEVSGSLSERGGMLGGSLEIGLPEPLVETSAKLAHVFGRSASGMRWATVAISGTPAQPIDDLRSQLDRAPVRSAPAEGGTEAQEDEFRELTTPPGGR